MLQTRCTGNIFHLLLNAGDLVLKHGAIFSLFSGLFFNLLKSSMYGLNECMMWMPGTVAIDAPDLVSHPGMKLAVVASGG